MVVFGLTSCYYDVQEELHPELASQACDTSVALYAVQIKTIMQNNCNSCHSTASASGGIITDTYTDLKRIADNGTLIGSINHAAGFRAMPQNLPKLSACNIKLIEKWVREGTQNN
jgi:cytochrome c5